MSSGNNPRNFLEKFFPASPYHKENLPEKYQTFAAVDACVFVLWAPEAILKNGDFHRNFLDQVPQRLKQETSASITCWVRDTNIKSITLRDRPLKQTRHATNTKQKIAALIRIRQQEETAAQILLADLQAIGYRTAVYLVKNTVPLEYQRTWPDGVQSPGLASVSFFKKNKSINWDFFQQYWFYSHTPFALDIHPLWKYERNVVLKVLTPEAPGYQGIVPLHIKHDADLSFTRFFSRDGKSALGNALRIQADVKRFIDLSAIETVAMREYVLR